MRLFVLFAGCAALACAQSTTTTYTADYANGGFAASSSSSSSDHTQTQTATSLNWQRVPLEQHEERVLRSDASGSVTETIVRRYDPTGQLISTDRTVTELRKLGNGNSTALSTVYHSDVNGQQQAVERTTTETRVSGTTTTVNTAVDRPTANGNLQTVEKRSAVTEEQTKGKEKTSSTTESIQRGNPDAGYREAERTVTTQTTSDGRTVTDSSNYEPGSDNGQLQFQERRVSTTSSTPNGEQSTVVDVYAPAADGTVRDPDRPPQVKEQQIITRTKNPDGSVVDTFSVRQTSVSDPTKLGEARPVTRTVCTGKCGEAPGTPAAGAAATAPAAAPSTAAPTSSKQ